MRYLLRQLLQLFSLLGLDRTSRKGRPEIGTMRYVWVYCALPLLVIIC